MVRVMMAGRVPAWRVSGRRTRAAHLVFGLFVALLIVKAGPAPAASGDISTYAGGGAAQPSQVLAVAVDSSDNVYFTETERIHRDPRWASRLRKIDPSGIVTTVAGGTAQGFCGDGGPALNACLYLKGPPGAVSGGGLDVDTLGNVYIADGFNNRIRKVDATGIIATVAGKGTPGFCGDGGPAVAACLDNPRDVAADASGNIFIVEGGRVRKVDAAGVITTVVITTVVSDRGVAGPCGNGTHSALCATAAGIAVDSSGNLFVADSSNNLIWRRDHTGGTSIVAGNRVRGFCGDGGRAVLACLSRPMDVSVDSGGSVYIADYSNGRVRKVDPQGIIATLAGEGGGNGYEYGDGGPATRAIMQPGGLATDSSSNLLIAGNWRIRKVDTAGIITGFYGGCPDGGEPTVICMGAPLGTALDATGQLLVSIWGNQDYYPPSGRIAKIDASGRMSTVVRGVGTATGIAIGPSGDIFVAEPANDRILKVDVNGNIETFAGGGVPSKVVTPPLGCLQHGPWLCIDGSQTDTRIVGLGDGAPAALAQLSSPFGVAADRLGNVYIADTGNHRVRKVNVSGVITTIAGNGSAEFCGDGDLAVAACLKLPKGIAVDANGNLFIADTGNGRIRKIDSNGLITTVADDLSLSGAITVDRQGTLFVPSANRVLRVSPAGAITTAAGSGVPGFCGDSGPASSACLSAPSGVAVDAAGNLFIADSNNRRIRLVAG